ncbi:MAG TPA: CoA transferase [Thermoplasmata archaeon]|nr:CoA transferase [Thermoplasmata archaeon]
MAPEGPADRIVPPFGPLQGIRILDSARVVAGPWASTYLGEFGAEVVHLEGPPFERPFSDPTRMLPPLLPEGASPEESISESWVQYSRNKLSVGLDLKRPEGREVFLDLIRRSDIWIESSRPGTYDALDLSDATVHAANPRLTIVHVSGFGQTGRPERVGAPSFDLIAQAYSGFLSLQGNPDPDPPMRSGTALNDTVTGLAAATAALMGYVHAQRTGTGQVVDVAQYEVFFTLLENLALDYFQRGVVRGRFGNAHPRLYPYNLERARDGWVALAAATPASWTRLRELLGLTDTRLDDPTFRNTHRELVDPAIERFCASRSIEELERIGRETDTAISRVYRMDEIARDPHFKERGMFVEWQDPVAGSVKGAGVAPKFQSTPGGVWRGAPWLGQDNDAVLGRLLGYSPDRIRSLRDDGVVGEHPVSGPKRGAEPFFVREGL